jgi:hypothetical protein
MIRNRLVIALVLSILLAICSCKNESDNSASALEPITIDIDEVLSDEPVYFSKLFSGFKIIPLENNEDCMFSIITNVKFNDEKIYVFDRIYTKSVFAFTRDGEFLHRVGTLGRGPGEYVQASDIDVDPVKGDVYIFDWNNKKLNIYDSKGDYRSSIKVGDYFGSFSLSDDGIYCFRSYPPRESVTDNLLFLFNDRGEVIGENLSYSELLQGKRVDLGRNGGNFFRSKGEIKFFADNSNTIYSITKGAVKPYIILSTKKHRLTQEDLDMVPLNSNTMEVFQIREQQNKLTNILGYSESDKFAFIIFEVGIIRYYLLYNFETKEAICSSKFVDDMTFGKPTLFQLHDEQFITFLNNGNVLQIKKLINDCQIVLPDAEKERILNIPDDYLPVIIIYDVKQE